MPGISCSGMRYQFEWRDVNPKDVPRENQEKLDAMIHCAVDLRMDHIETARRRPDARRSGRPGEGLAPLRVAQLAGVRA
jgi:predicted aldo/keto reductase-like oxidoreductase